MTAGPGAPVALPGAPQAGACRHCGAAMASAAAYCCHGCEAAAELLAGAGLDRWYEERREFAPRPEPIPGLAALPATTLPDGRVELRVQLEGLRCASCVWVCERVLAGAPGVAEARVSYGTGRARVVFDPALTDVGAVAGRVAALGYRPRAVGAAAAGEDTDLLIRLGVAAFGAANVMLASATLYAGWFGVMEERYAALFRWTSLALATPVATWSARPFFEGAWRGLRHGVVPMDLPIALGVAVMYVGGVVATLHGEEAWLDSLTMLVTLLLAGRVLEGRGRRSARDAAESLAATLPRVARRLTADGIETVPVSSLAVGDVLELGAGEEIGADGRVERGDARVRMALLTGESEPVAVGAGDPVHAGGVLTDGALRVRVEAVGGATLADRMAQELRNATERDGVASLPDRVAPWFTAATLLVSAATFAGWTWVGGVGAAVHPTVAVLVVACPCALALARPLAVASGLGAAARRGLVVRSGDALLRLADIDTVVFDKTGTVTGGVPVVAAGDDEVLRLASGVERGSVHPVGRAIVAEAVRRRLPLPDGHEIREVAGEGISGRVDGRRIALRGDGAGRVAVTADGALLGTLEIRDIVRGDAARTVAGLRALGLRVVMSSGDRPEIAARIGAAVGVDEVRGGMDPLAKKALVDELRAAGRRVLFCGDGLNDGPALSAADVGVAMAGGAASAVLVADGVVAREALAPVLAALRAARATTAVIRGNVARSLTYNVASVSAAAFGLVNPLVGAILMPLSSGLVVWGALGVERRVAADDAEVP